MAAVVEKKHHPKDQEIRFDTAGMSFSLSAERQVEVGEEAPLRVELVRDPNNIQDHNAVEIFLTEFQPGLQIGYVPKDIAEKLAPLMDSGKIRFVEAWMTDMGEFNGHIRIVFQRKSS